MTLDDRHIAHLQVYGPSPPESINNDEAAGGASQFVTDDALWLLLKQESRAAVIQQTQVSVKVVDERAVTDAKPVGYSENLARSSVIRRGATPNKPVLGRRLRHQKGGRESVRLEFVLVVREKQRAAVDARVDVSGVTEPMVTQLVSAREVGSAGWP